MTFGPTTENITGTDNRVFTATSLIPRTSYTFQVSPVSDSATGSSMFSMVNHSTAISPGLKVTTLLALVVVLF